MVKTNFIKFIDKSIFLCFVMESLDVNVLVGICGLLHPLDRLRFGRTCKRLFSITMHSRLWRHVDLTGIKASSLPECVLDCIEILELGLNEICFLPKRVNHLSLTSSAFTRILECGMGEFFNLSCLVVFGAGIKEKPKNWNSNWTVFFPSLKRVRLLDCVSLPWLLLEMNERTWDFVDVQSLVTVSLRPDLCVETKVFNGAMSVMETEGTIFDPPSPILISCGLCDEVLWPSLCEYQLREASQRGISVEIVTDVPPARWGPSSQEDDNKRNCSRNCHKKMWLIDCQRDNDVIEHYGKKYAIACGTGKANFKFI